MEDTDILILAFKDNVCVGSAWKQTGKDGERFNRQTVNEWMKRGWDVRMLRRDDPAAKAAHDQMWENAAAAAGARLTEAAVS